MTQLEKCFRCKHKQLNLITQNPHKKLGVAAYIYSHNTREVEAVDFLANWSTWINELHI